MASEVEICNLALSHIRAGSINTMTESSLQAQQCKLHFGFVRDQLLEDAPWGFATRVRALSELSSTSVFNWAYVYQYPSDCLRINRLILNWEYINQSNSALVTRYMDRGLPQPDFDAPVQYQVFNDGSGNKVIAANDSELRANYNMRVTDPNLFSNLFITAFSHLLASRVAVALAGAEQGRQLMRDHLQLYQAVINDAVAADLNERHTPTADSEFITIRS